MVIKLLGSQKVIHEYSTAQDGWPPPNHCVVKESTVQGTARWNDAQRKVWGKEAEFHALSKHTTLPKPPCVHQPGSFLNRLL